MARFIQRLACAATVPALLAGAPMTGAAPAAQRPAYPAWTVAASPALPFRPAVVPAAGAPQGNLLGVDFLSPASGWAVGLYCVPGCGKGSEHTLIEHWNGSGWSRVASPSPSPLVGLSSVSAVSARDAWAAGGYFTRAGNFQTLIVHWNGSTWSRVASPDPGGGFAVLNAVTALSARDAWAAGYYCVRRCQLDGEVDSTLILHWNGSTWSRVASPNPGPGYSILSGLTAVSSRNAWAAGTYATRPGYYRTLILHWNGHRWSRAASPSPHPGDNELLAVTAVSARDAWAVGHFCPRHCGRTAPPARTLILHWNGHRWSRAASPSPSADDDVLAGVTGVSARTAWAAGYFCVRHCAQVSPGDALQVDHTLILRWNGHRWSRATSPNPGRGGNELSGIAALTAGKAWAVGHLCPVACGNTTVLHPLILRRRGRHWSG